MEFDYKNVFLKIEDSLRKYYSEVTQKKFDDDFLYAKKLTYEEQSDDWYFNVLKMIPFYAGFKADTVKMYQSVIDKYFPDYKTVAAYDENDVKRMIDDPNMINASWKIKPVIKNAKKFVEIVSKYGSVHNFFETFQPQKSEENLLKLRAAIHSPFFAYLGDITVNHFLTEIGLNVLKPDRVVQRIFERLGLIDDLSQIEESIEHGRKFAEATGFSIRYIDLVFVVYGQVSKYAICLEKNPKCELCQLTSKCKYFNKFKMFVK